MPSNDKLEQKPFIKVVYFDEQSASDYLDIAAGGRAETAAEQMRERATASHAKVAARVAARLSWLPFVGGSAEVEAGVDAAAVSRSFLSKTLSNTILTDYIDAAADDNGITKMSGVAVAVPEKSFTHMKLYTPLMAIARTSEAGVDLAALDDALERAKGYYELLATQSHTGLTCVFRFNIRAFRNNYGLGDLRKMNLVFHGILVGHVREEDLIADAEMRGSDAAPVKSGLELLNEADGVEPDDDGLLDIYDILLAGIER